MTRITYYFTVLSPFTYLAGDRLERIAAERGASIDYRPFDIMAVFSETGGTPPGQRHVSRKEYRMQEIERVARHNGMPITLQPAHWPTDQGPASRAIIAASMAGADAGALARAALTACWVQERNIGDPETVAALVEECGMNASALASHADAAAAAFEGNAARAVADGAFGAPFYIVGDDRFWGQDRLEMLDAALR